MAEHKFYPYTNNGGSTLGLRGADYAILAGDTRSTSGYSINSRLERKVFPIEDGSSSPNSHIALSVVGFAADGRDLKERLDAMAAAYRYRHGKGIGITACAQRLSTLLYQKRFFPYQLQTMLAGVDGSGRGVLYNYDPAGSCEERAYCGAGVAGGLMVPFVDGQVGTLRESLDCEVGEGLVRDAFRGAAERHVEVGDYLQMMIVTKNGIHEVFADLRKD
ncbi:nucleophile aminohydrolase [Aspergillus taichungensis]|uniref:Nucleophile aminohydrolase n=1 Tax=Aspergillus taichungensis TaxID=482145 RepID=A0A2J5I2K7_9EURO|nr:nucleophile aminohydrolase [Aspergillus taichungensis]